jgi:6-phosphogluconolactonase
MYALDERRNLGLPGTRENTLEFTKNIIIEILAGAIKERGRATLALSGGSTPKALYALFKKDDLDWSKVKVFFSDERMVPLDNNDSNFKMAWEAGFQHLATPAQIFPMVTDQDPEKSALKYEKLIESSIPLDLVLLGMGDDGHTASLFPRTHALHANDRLVVANFLPEKEVWRLTMTYQLINEARHIIVLVTGKDKAETLQKIFNGPYDPDLFPAQKVGTPRCKALWIIDKEAASLIQSPAC